MLFRAPAPRSSSLELTFELPSDHPAGRISVVGTFNGWQPGAHAFVVAGPVQRVSVRVPAGEAITFRYLGQWWFDEPDADWIDDQGSHVDPSSAEQGPRRAEGHATLSPAEYAVEVAHKRRKKAEKAAGQAAEKARRKAKKAAAKLQKMEQAGAQARRALHDVEDRTERA